MADISKELEAWKSARYGKDVRQAQIDLSNKLNKEVEDGTNTIREYTDAEQDRVDAEKERVEAAEARTEEFDRLKRESETATKAANDAAEAVNGAVNGVINDNAPSEVTTYSSAKLERDIITTDDIDALAES